MPRLVLKRALGKSRLFAARIVRDGWQTIWFRSIYKKIMPKASKCTRALWREKRAQNCETMRLVVLHFFHHVGAIEIFDIVFELQSYTCELQQDHRFPNQFFQKVAMDKAPSKRHRSKSAPEKESKTKRPSALRKPTVSSSTPAERLQKYLAEKKVKDRASSATSKGSSRGASRASKKDALKKHEKKEKKEKKDVKKKVSGGKAVPVMKVNKGDKFEKSKSKSMSKEDKKKAAVKEQKKGKDVKKGERECSRKTKEDKKVKEDEGRKAETKEKDGRKNQTTETEKKPDQPGTIDKKTKGEAKDTSKKKGEEKIKFLPSQKKKVEHIFHTPPAKASHSPASASSLTSKQRAEMHLRSLGDLLQASDDDSMSATDMDEFLSEIATEGKKAAADEAKEDKDPLEVEKWQRRAKIRKSQVMLAPTMEMKVKVVRMKKVRRNLQTRTMFPRTSTVTKRWDRGMILRKMRKMKTTKEKIKMMMKRVLKMK